LLCDGDPRTRQDSAEELNALGSNPLPELAFTIVDLLELRNVVPELHLCRMVDQNLHHFVVIVLLGQVKESWIYRDVNALNVKHLLEDVALAKLNHLLYHQVVVLRLEFLVRIPKLVQHPLIVFIVHDGLEVDLTDVQVNTHVSHLYEIHNRVKRNFIQTLTNFQIVALLRNFFDKQIT